MKVDEIYKCVWSINFMRRNTLLFLLLSNVVHTNITMGDFKIKNKTEFEVGKNDTEEQLEDAADKVKAGAKALGKKVADPDRDLESEYQEEKIKEKLD
jgi:hypothetical protein